MRMRIQFSATNGRVDIPVNYNHIIQSFIYNNISDKLSEFLHNIGYKTGKRSFKMFTFSRLQGKCRYKKEDKKLTFDNNFSLWVASPENEFLESYATELLNRDEIKIGENKVYINSVEVSMTPAFEGDILIKMLSPVTVYSTLEKKDGKSKTYYYHPSEPEFSELVLRNIENKYRALYKSEPPEDEFQIKPEKVTNRSQKIITYKDFIIKGWLGVYRLKGHPEMLKLAWDAGIGAKNPQGFGMFEIVEG